MMRTVRDATHRAAKHDTRMGVVLHATRASVCPRLACLGREGGGGATSMQEGLANLHLIGSGGAMQSCLPVCCLQMIGVTYQNVLRTTSTRAHQDTNTTTDQHTNTPTPPLQNQRSRGLHASSLHASSLHASSVSTGRCCAVLWSVPPRGAPRGAQRQCAHRVRQCAHRVWQCAHRVWQGPMQRWDTPAD